MLASGMQLCSSDLLYSGGLSRSAPLLDSFLFLPEVLLTPFYQSKMNFANTGIFRIRLRNDSRGIAKQSGIL